MTKLQAAAFYEGLSKIELRYSGSLGRFTPLHKYVIVFRDPFNQLQIKPLNGIDQETILWTEIIRVFQQVTAS